MVSSQLYKPFIFWHGDIASAIQSEIRAQTGLPLRVCSEPALNAPGHIMSNAGLIYTPHSWQQPIPLLFRSWPRFRGFIQGLSHDSSLSLDIQLLDTADAWDGVERDDFKLLRGIGLGVAEGVKKAASSLAYEKLVINPVNDLTVQMFVLAENGAGLRRTEHGWSYSFQKQSTPYKPLRRN